MASRPPVASATLLAFLLLLLLGLEPATCRSWTRATPRVLHEPFHIDPPPAPAPAPAAPPAPEPGTPPESSSNTPFFPLPPSYSPPAPPDQTSAGAGGTTGLPANVNGGGAQPATKAASGDNGGHHGSGKIVIAIIVCLCVIAFLGGLLFCLNRHRVRYSAHGSANWDSATGAKFTDETPLASSATTPAAHGHGHGHGNGRVLSPAKVVALNAGSAELLYLGTFGNRNSANSHVVEEPPKPENEAPPAPRNPNPNPNPNRNAAPFPASPPSPRFAPARRQRFPEAEPRPQRQLSRERHGGGSSPEIHPLPPLSKKPRPAAAAAVAAVSAQSAPSASTDSSDEESFYSPRADSSSSGSPRTCKKRLFSPAPAPAPAPAQKSRLSFSSSESPSSSASSTSSPAPSSPSLDSPPAAPITPKRAHPNSQNCSSSDAPQQQQSPAPAPARKPPPPPPPPPPPFRPPTVSENNPAKVKPQSKGRTDPALQTDLPRLPVRPTPRFLSQSRSGRHSPSGSSVLPAVEIPLPPPPSRTGLFSARTGQAIEHLRPISENSVENSADSAASSDQTPKPKLKPLHWDKVRASPEKAMVWDQLKSGSFQLNEEMIETLFVYNTPQAAKTDPAKRSAANSPASLNQRLLDPKKSQNIAILLRALNVTKEEVCEALVDGTYDSIGIELLETLSKMAPSRDEELRLKEYNGDISKIGVSERFLKALLEVPFAFKRVDAMIYKANFEEDFVCINKSLQTLEAACEELRSSRLFLKLLEAVLKTGNRMNVGTARGDAQAFKLDTLLKLVDVKGTDGKTTLLHFVVQEIIKAEGARVVATTVSENNAQDQTQKDMDDDEHKKLGLQVVAGLSTELSNVKQAAGMDSEALSASVSNLARGLGKLKENLQIMMKPQQQQQSVEIQGNFFRSMSLFVEKAENDIRQIQEAAKKAFIRLRETTAYFHGDAAKEEARPLRFFMVVRDFLGILDQVCREIGRTQIKNKHRFSPSGPPPVIAHPISLPVFPRAYERRYDSSEDESSSS